MEATARSYRASNKMPSHLVKLGKCGNLTFRLTGQGVEAPHVLRPLGDPVFKHFLRCLGLLPLERRVEVLEEDNRRTKKRSPVSIEGVKGDSHCDEQNITKVKKRSNFYGVKIFISKLRADF